MKRLLVALSITFLFALILFCPKAKAFPTQAYVCLYIPAFSVPVVLPNAVISLGEYVGILEDFNMSFMPNPMIGAGGFFISLYAIEGYCDESMFLAIYINMNGLPVFEAGISISRLFSSSNESSEKLELNNINIKDYLVNPAFILPTKGDLKLLKPSLIEARSLYPQYKELIDIALMFIDTTD